MTVTASDVEKIGEDFRKTMKDLCGDNPGWTEKYRPKIWAEVTALLAIYAEKAKAVGVDPKLELEEE